MNIMSKEKEIDDRGMMTLLSETNGPSKDNVSGQMASIFPLTFDVRAQILPKIVQGLLLRHRFHLNGDELVCLSVDSDADTEVQDEDESPLPMASVPSFIPETPLSRDSGRSGWEEGVRMSAQQREEVKERGASVCADAVGDRGDAARSDCAVAAVVVAVTAAVALGDRMEVEEQEVLSGVCGMMEEYVGGGAGVSGVGV